MPLKMVEGLVPGLPTQESIVKSHPRQQIRLNSTSVKYQTFEQTGINNTKVLKRFKLHQSNTGTLFVDTIMKSNQLHEEVVWTKSVEVLRPVHTREPINPRSLPLWKNGRIGYERALIGESVCWSKIQRGLVGRALRGRGERDKFFNRLKNGRGWPRSQQVVCWAGVQRGGRRYSVGWSYFDRVWSAIPRVSRSGLSGLKLLALTGELESLNTK